MSVADVTAAREEAAPAPTLTVGSTVVELRPLTAGQVYELLDKYDSVGTNAKGEPVIWPQRPSQLAAELVGAEQWAAARADASATIDDFAVFVPAVIAHYLGADEGKA